MPTPPDRNRPPSAAKPPPPAAGSGPTDDDLLAAVADQPAPLLPALHAFQGRDGYLSEAALRAVSSALKIPLAELYGTVSFYHHFAREPGGRDRPRVCTGPICAHAGADALITTLTQAGLDPAPMPCPGRCDQPVPVLRGDQVLVGTDANTLAAEPSPLPPVVTADSAADANQCLLANIRAPERASLAGYRQSGGYQGLERALTQDTPAALRQQIHDSGLAGRGGAGFPTGRKWQAVAEAPGQPKTIVCNADEGEPGCFKDRLLMDHDPHALIEGMIAAGYATGASQGFIYLRYEYPDTAHILARALDEARGAGLLGDDILGTGYRFDIHIRRGAGAYVCGEETSLLSSLEGKHPFPRNRPPFPVTHGYRDLPTVINNVETLAAVGPILQNGAAWYRDLGRGDHAGTKIISLSGDIARPGNYEIPLGLPLSTLLYDWAGGPLPGRKIQAVTMAGLSGGFLAGDDLDVTLDDPSIKALGSFLGAGGVMVFDDRRDMVAVAENAMAFFAEESCGKCFPCRIGTQRLVERLGTRPATGPIDETTWRREVNDLGATMMATSACGLGQAAPLITESLIRYFPDQVRRHLQNRAAKRA
ncbi:MAG: NAD(P)H-dependent oxidoreductase subunit E [Haliangiales bacterium]